MGRALKKDLSKNGTGLAFPEAANQIAQIGREFHLRGWALGTSGNFSAVLCRNPLYFAITPTGVDKGTLTPSHILEVDESGNPVDGIRRSSAETSLHVTVARQRAAGAVLHTHSVWSTTLSDEYAHEGGIAIEGYEMLKGLEGIHTHEHREWLPILDNSQDMVQLARAVERALERNPGAHGFLLKGHGLYSWGSDLAEAKRHIEVLEFLLEVLGRGRAAPARR